MMNGFDKLELSTETLRELTPAELGQVVGGTLGGNTTWTPLTVAILGYTIQQVTQLPHRLDSVGC